MNGYSMLSSACQLSTILVFCVLLNQIVLRKMGCDGGTIPRRDELVRVKKKPETKDKNSDLVFQWRYCAITQLVLQLPIVMCGLGKLYNKIALIEALINKESMPESIKHIKSLKDIKDLKLSPNPSYKDSDQKGEGIDSRSAPYICPVIGLEMSGKFRFVALWSCGCVFSERALKEIPSKICHKCQKPFEENDVVVLNGNEDDLIIMRQRMELRQQKNKKTKSGKVKVKEEPEQSASGPSSGSASTSTSNEEPTVAFVHPSAKINIDSSDSKLKMAKPVSISSSLKRTGSLKKPEHDTKKMKPEYSVAKDPKSTDVYKSLFTSHKSEQEQGRAHWITYNPFYN